MGRRTRTLLPTSEKLLKPSAYEVQGTTRNNLEAQKGVQSMQYNRGTKNLPPLLVGDTIRMKLPGEQNGVSVSALVLSAGALMKMKLKAEPIAETDANCALLQNHRPGTVLRK